MENAEPIFGPGDDSREPNSSRTARNLKIMVTGGGTGGHAVPASATIQAIRKIAERDGWKATFLYLGSKDGVEVKIANELGVDYEGIETGKIRRARSVIGLFSFANLRDLTRVPAGYFQALSIVGKFKPDVVLSTGGYVSVPGVLAAGALEIPVVTHEQTVQVGLANKINFTVASKIALSFDETMTLLSPRFKGNTQVTGNPVRDIIFGEQPLKAAKLFGLDMTEKDLPTVYITGGAQGSRLINRVVEDVLPSLVKFCRIIHQCGVQKDGDQDFDRLTAAKVKLSPELRDHYAVTQFVGPEIGDVYCLADLVIGRSGAGTVSEICALGKPSILIPLVPTGGDEQTRNAMRLVDAGGARILRQDELSGTTLLAVVESVLADRINLSNMGERARMLDRSRGAADRLATLVIEMAAIRK